MIVTPRPLYLAAFLGFSLLLCSIYLYYNGYLKSERFNRVQNIFPSTMKKINSGTVDNSKDKDQKTANLGFIHAFVASISVIVVSELGDKTFFIAAILAMRHSRLITYAGAMGALGAMTVLSALLGNIVTNFIPRIYTYYVSTILFAGFGIKMLKDAYSMSPNEGTEEYEEVQQEVEKAEASNDLESGENNGVNENTLKVDQPVLKPKSTGTKITTIIRRFVSPIFIQSFIMTFLAVCI